jgi:hypothetical protein
MHRIMLQELLGTKLLPPEYRGRGITGWIDLVTLFAVLGGATLLGLNALGVDIAGRWANRCDMFTALSASPLFGSGEGSDCSRQHLVFFTALGMEFP